MNNFSATYYELPEDEEVVKWVESAPLKGYEYVKANEASNACLKKSTPELKKKCFKKFEDLDNGKFKK